jgi:hypothetical protein
MSISLWAMPMLRTGCGRWWLHGGTVQGRLSEIFGERTIKSDELMRRLDLYGLATRSVAAQDDRDRDSAWKPMPRV